MGYPMAVNLRKGLSSEYTLLICDVNKEALAKFQKEMEGKGPIEVVENGLEAIKKAVRLTFIPTRFLSSSLPSKQNYDINYETPRKIEERGKADIY